MSDDTDRISLEASEWLVRLRETTDDAEVRKRFADWKSADPRHARASAEMEAMFDLIGAVPCHAPQIEASPVMVARMSSRPLLRRPIAAMALAACLALIVSPQVFLRLRADHQTGAGQMQQIALTDGSHVRLGPDSAIRIRDDTQGREIDLLEGQAWFDVTHDPDRPFRVKAGGVTVTDIGTAFDVRMIGDDTMVDVGRGRVHVQDNRGSPSAGRDMVAGDWARIDRSHQMVTGTQAADLAGAWQTAEIPIRGRNVANAIDEIRPWYRGRIILADASVGRATVTGIYQLKDPVEALRALVEPHGGRIVQLTPWLILILRA